MVKLKTDLKISEVFKCCAKEGLDVARIIYNAIEKAITWKESGGDDDWMQPVIETIPVSPMYGRKGSIMSRQHTQGSVRSGGFGISKRDHANSVHIKR